MVSAEREWGWVARFLRGSQAIFEELDDLTEEEARAQVRYHNKAEESEHKNMRLVYKVRSRPKSIDFSWVDEK